MLADVLVFLKGILGSFNQSKVVIMAARAIWKGRIQFADVDLPIKFYSALEDRNVHFRLLHETNHVPLKQRMIDPETDTAVEYSDARRGYEVQEGKFVVLTEEEREALEPEDSRTIEITRFVDPGELNHQWYDRPYYLGPDGDAEAYFSFVEALANQQMEGVARWTMRKKRYIGALREQNGYLMMVTLHHPEEIIQASDLTAPEGRELDAKEKDLGETFVDRLTAEFDPSEYEDEYRERVMELIEAKKQGGTLDVEEYEAKAETASLSEALEASLESV